MDHLQTTLEVLIYHKLYAKHTKCYFGCSEIVYLGHFNLRWRFMGKSWQAASSEILASTYVPKGSKGIFTFDRLLP